MADVYAIFGTLLALGIAFPGMLTALWLLFPPRVERASQQLTDSPGRTFFIGLAGTFFVAIPITILFVAGLPFTSVLGALTLTLVLAFAAIGAAGLTQKMSHHLGAKIGSDKPVRAFLGSAAALEMAAVFPFIGWFLVIPVVLILSLGAAIASLFARAKAVKVQADSSTLPSTPVEA